MYQAKGDFLWAQTSSLLALQVNMNREKGKQPVSPSEFNPFAKQIHKGSVKITGKAAWNMLKSIVTNDKIRTRK